MLRFAARGHRVFFVERLAGLEHFWRYPDLRRRRQRRWREGMREIRPNLWIWAPFPLLLGRYYSAFIARLNADLVRRWLTPHLRQVKITNPILWLYLPEHAPLVGRFWEQLAVYHCIDEFTVGTRGPKRQIITSLEADLLQRADVVFANSKLTFERKQVLNSNTYRITSGADVEHFAQAANPLIQTHPNVAQLAHPVLAFVGNVNEKTDVSLLASVARARPQWSIVLIGQPFPEAVNLRPIQRLPNVHWLGRRRFESLPSLLHGVDLCLLPYAQGEATRYRSPLKLYEYLATGKPIVSTPHPEVSDFAGAVTIASPDHLFVEAIEDALRNDTAQKEQRRMEIARQHSWDTRVDEMQRIIAKHLGTGQPA